MTLEEYQKVLEEKRKALVALKNEERKVVLDKELESMQQLSSKKSDEEIFVKLVTHWHLNDLIINVVLFYQSIRSNTIELIGHQGSDKDKRKDAAEKEERAKKVFVLSTTFVVHVIVQVIFYFWMHLNSSL